MVHGREPYDAQTIAMLHDRRSEHGNFLSAARPSRDGIPTLLRYASAPQPTLTQTDVAFISRMDADVEDRRYNSFIAEVKKDPRFRPSMLASPTSNFTKVRPRGH